MHSRKCRLRYCLHLLPSYLLPVTLEKGPQLAEHRGRETPARFVFKTGTRDYMQAWRINRVLCAHRHSQSCRNVKRLRIWYFSSGSVFLRLSDFLGPEPLRDHLPCTRRKRSRSEVARDGLVFHHLEISHPLLAAHLAVRFGASGVIDRDAGPASGWDIGPPFPAPLIAVGPRRRPVAVGLCGTEYPLSHSLRHPWRTTGPI